MLPLSVDNHELVYGCWEDNDVLLKIAVKVTLCGLIPMSLSVGQSHSQTSCGKAGPK